MKKNYFIESPTYTSHRILNKENKQVFYKMDCYQPTGSFKIRGMELLCRRHFNKGKKYFVASSGGNAGYSLAYVGQEIGAKVKVVVPQSTPRIMTEKIESLGAEVEVFGKVWDEADTRAKKIAKENDAVYVSPFDDPLLWEGHSSLIDECATQISQPDKIIVSVGGGGLLCGILLGMKRNGWNSTQVITTETTGAASFYKSYEAKEVVELKEINTIATSLGAKRITPMALELALEMNVRPFLVSDNEAKGSCKRFLEEYNVLVEPACGAALSIPYFHSELIEQKETALVIVCGGVNIDAHTILSAV